MLILTDVLLSFVLEFEWGSNGWAGEWVGWVGGGKDNISGLFICYCTYLFFVLLFVILCCFFELRI